MNNLLAPPHHVHPQLVQERKGDQSSEDELQEVLVPSVSYWHSLWVSGKQRRPMSHVLRVKIGILIPMSKQNHSLNIVDD